MDCQLFYCLWLKYIYIFLGVGISFLSYNKKMQIGIMIDKVLINTNDEAHEILENTATAIKDLDEQANNIIKTTR